MRNSINKIAINFAFCVLIFCKNTNAQNLVPNPSFEDSVNCTGPWNCNCSLEISYPWFNPNTGTSDYYSNSLNCGYQYFNQNPRTGNAYVGFYGWVVQYREYIEVKLDSSLQQGAKYCLSFYISRNEGCGGAIDKIGAYFSVDSLLGINPFILPVLPQIETNTGVLISDTLNWIQISGEFIAQGGESFLTIGNFRDTAQCTWQIVDTNNILCSLAYYYIDDVSLFRCDSLSSINEFDYLPIINVYYTDEFIGVQINENISQFTYEMIDIQGLVVKSVNISTNKNLLEIEKHSIKHGLYFLRLNYNNMVYTKKIIVF